MGPLFNGMTIASERNVQAAGRAATEYADNRPQESDTPANDDDTTTSPSQGTYRETSTTLSGSGESDNCWCSTPASQDQGIDEVQPTPDQQILIDLTNNDTKPNETQNDIIKVTNELNSGESQQVSEVADKLGSLVKVTEDVDKDLNNIETIVNLINDALDVATASDPAAEALNLLLQSAEKTLQQDIEKEIGQLVENAMKEKLEDELSVSAEALAEEQGFDLNSAMSAAGYSIVRPSGNPAAKGCAIAHGAAAMVVTSSTDGTQIAVAKGQNGDDARTLASIASKAGPSGVEAMNQFYTEEGEIKHSSTNVHFGGRLAARVNHRADCHLHAYSKIAEGSKTVFVNGWPVARVGNKLTCGGIVSEGVSRINVDMRVSSSFKLCINAGINQQIYDLMPTLAYYLPILADIYEEHKELSDIDSIINPPPKVADKSDGSGSGSSSSDNSSGTGEAGS